jgi:hypothetical protein
MITRIMDWSVSGSAGSTLTERNHFYAQTSAKLQHLPAVKLDMQDMLPNPTVVLSSSHTDLCCFSSTRKLPVVVVTGAPQHLDPGSPMQRLGRRIRGCFDTTGLTVVTWHFVYLYCAGSVVSERVWARAMLAEGRDCA